MTHKSGVKNNPWFYSIMVFLIVESLTLLYIYPAPVSGAWLYVKKLMRGNEMRWKQVVSS